MLDRDQVLQVALKLEEVLLDVVIEDELLPVDKDLDERRREGLRAQGEVEEHINADRHLGLERGEAITLLEDDRTAHDDRDRDAKTVRIDLLRDDRVDL